jgi:hypothetical protein
MKGIVILATGVALMMPAMALAQGSPTCQAYNPQLCSVNSNKVTTTPTTSAAGTTSPTATTAASTLPFTGLNIGLLVLGGGALLGAGFVMRRFSRRLN